MSQIAKAFRNLVAYLKIAAERRRRRKKEKAENPDIYPLF